MPSTMPSLPGPPSVPLRPVGTAGATAGPPRRRNGFRDGSSTGPLHSYDVRGCAAEAAAIALTGRYDASLAAWVTPEGARRIGER
ncbi:hypothetical protein ACFVIM_04475 [Streptomyces sp. NPDC057638]|uniref:hypothetical protein n=1 Tax=Streptomyces sp. NPDC057638 TaxID=3346190 RepID=UPI0036ABC81E